MEIKQKEDKKEMCSTVGDLVSASKSNFALRSRAYTAFIFSSSSMRLARVRSS